MWNGGTVGLDFFRRCCDDRYGVQVVGGFDLTCEGSLDCSEFGCCCCCCCCSVGIDDSSAGVGVGSAATVSRTTCCSMAVICNVTANMISQIR